MRKDTSFSDRKLTMDEFSKKYWMEGETPYQYHTGSIEDGRDEREQFVFNNIRAIWERMKFHNEQKVRESGEIWRRIRENERKMERLTLITVLFLAYQVLLHTLRNK